MMEWYLPDEVPHWTLSAVLDDSEGGFREAFEGLYGLGDEGPTGYIWGMDAKSGEVLASLHSQHEEAKQLFHLARLLFGGATTLIHPAELSDEQASVLRDAAEALSELTQEANATDLERSSGKLHFLLSCLEFHAYRDLVPDVRSVAGRMFKLVSAFVRGPGENTRGYLTRAATCYLLTLDVEFCVVARSALEQRLQEVLVNMGDDPEELSRLGLFALIERGQPVLSAEVRTAAHFVRISANRAIHEAPDFVPAADEVLEALASVLGHLDTRGKGVPHAQSK